MKKKKKKKKNPENDPSKKLITLFFWRTRVYFSRRASLFEIRVGSFPVFYHCAHANPGPFMDAVLYIMHMFLFVDGEFL